ERDDVAAQLLAGHAGRIGGADQRADRGARDRHRLDAHLVERLDHHDVAETARPAAAKREREGFHVAPASCANRQAAAASGCTIAALAGACSLVAVPSRTRPTMPWEVAAMREEV